MRTCCCNLQSAFDRLLSFHILKIEWIFVFLNQRIQINSFRLNIVLTIQKVDHLRKIFRTDHLNPIHYASFFGVFLGNDDSFESLLLSLDRHR